MKCPSCSFETHRVTVFENGLSQCPYCPVKYVPKPAVGLFIKHASGIHQFSRRTAAHDADISRRRVAEDGKSIVRDFKKVFV